MIKLKFKRLSEHARLPIRATPGSAGVDLFVDSLSADSGLGQVVYGSGVAAEIPQGHVGLLFPRSSVYKTSQRMCNSVGVIDSDYRGEIKARFDLSGGGFELYKPGERFAQLVVVPLLRFEIEESDELTSTERGEGGFGSTGKGEINEHQESSKEKA